MRNVRVAAAPPAGWTADWQIEDRYRLLAPEANVHLRYHPGTNAAQACTAESWVALWGFAVNEDAWVPTLILRRQTAQPPLASTFAGVIEPYSDAPVLKAVQRLAVSGPAGEPFPDANVALEIALADGGTDLLLALDTENPLELTPAWPATAATVPPPWQVRLDGQLCLIRRDAAGAVRRLVLCRCKAVDAAGVAVRLAAPVDLIEILVEEAGATVRAGDAAAVESVVVDGRQLTVRAR
jgi:hypothetical protein